MSYFTIGYGIIPTASAAEVKQAVEEVAPAIIEEQIGPAVDTAVDTKMADAVAAGESDDVRTYATREAFPAEGIDGVEYIALDTGYEYAWKDGAYTLLNEHTALTDSDIENLDWD